MKRLFLLYLFLHLYNFSIASESDSIRLYGQVFDAKTHKQLEGVSVSVSSLDNCLIDADSTRNLSSPTFPQYFYTLKVAREGGYQMHFYIEGYDSLSIDITVPKRKDRLFAMHEVLLHKERLLDEVVVKASKIMMVMKEDTLVYDADAFYLSDGATLDALIQQLPNVTIEAGGRIMVNGHFVSELLLNGRDFLKGNSETVLKNLPVYVVDKLKVYQRTPEHASIMSRDSSEHLLDPWVIDVNLKRQYNQAWLANTDFAAGWDDNYWGRIFAMRTTDFSHLFIYGNANNLSDNAAPDKSGGWSATDGLASGLSKIYRFGFDYTTEPIGTRNKLSAQSSVARIVSDERSISSQTLFLPEGDVYQKNRNHKEIQQWAADWRVDFSSSGNSYHVNATAKANLQKKESCSIEQQAQLNTSLSESYRGALLDSLFTPVPDMRLQDAVINAYRENVAGNWTNWGGELNVSLILTPAFLKNSVNLQVRDFYDHHVGNSFSRYYLKDVLSDDYRHRYVLEPSYTNRLYVDANYQMFRRGDLSVSFQYGFSHIRQNRSRRIYRLDVLGGAWSEPDSEIDITMLPSTTDSLSQATDAKNTYDTDAWKSGNKLGVSVNYTKQGKYLATFTVPVWLRRESVNDVRNSVSSRLTYQHAAFEPAFTFVTFKGLKLFYNLGVREAPLSYKLTYEDNSDPLNIVRGNPGLKSTQTHQVSVQYSMFNPKGLCNIATQTVFLSSRNDIARRRLYDKETGVTVSLPENVNGNWRMESRNSYSQSIDKNRFWRVGADVNLRYINSVDYISESAMESAWRSSVHNFIPDVTIHTNWHNGGVQISSFVGGQWNHATSARQSFQTINAVNMKYGAKAMIELPLQFFLSMDLTMFQRMGYSDATMNDNSLIWNAGIEKKMGKAKRWTIKAEGIDILGQRSNVSSFVNAQGLTETWRNVIPSYGLLHIMYRFDMKSRKHLNEVK